MSFIIGPTVTDETPTSSPTRELLGQFHPLLYNYTASRCSQPEIEATVCGARGVGKSSLIHQLIEREFDHVYRPTIQDTHYMQLEDATKSGPFTLIDTPWDPSYPSLREGLRFSVGFMILFAVDDRHSFEEAQEILEYCLSCREDDKPKTVLLVANKCDLLSKASAAVKLSEGVQLAREIGCEFWPISTKNRDEVLDVFQRFRDLLWRQQRKDRCNTQQDW